MLNLKPKSNLMINRSLFFLQPFEHAKEKIIEKSSEKFIDSTDGSECKQIL